MADRRLLVTLAVCLVSQGCVEHASRIDPPASSVDDKPVQVLLDDQYRSDWRESVEERRGLPIETRYTAYRAQDGKLWRADHTVSTPLPWWQAFPADLVTDLLWPGTITVVAEQQVELREVPRLGLSDLDNLADEYGYGSRTTSPARAPGKADAHGSSGVD